MGGQGSAGGLGPGGHGLGWSLGTVFSGKGEEGAAGGQPVRGPGPGLGRSFGLLGEDGALEG